MQQNENNNLIQVSNSKQRKYKPIIKRKKKQITVSRLNSTKYLDTLKGLRCQTKQLNINIKTITVNILEQCVNVSEIGQIEQEIFKTYIKAKPCFDARDNLFGNIPEKQMSQQKRKAHEIIKNKCLEHYETVQMVKNILQSDKMYIINKLIFIKYLAKIMEGVLDPTMQWKQGSAKRYFSKLSNR